MKTDKQDGSPVSDKDLKAVGKMFERFPAPLKVYPATAKQYQCTRCGCISTKVTNHYGPTWSWNRVSVCPACPPFAKYPEFGGQTIWNCLETEPTS